VLADNSAQLITAARARSLDTLGRAERALAAAEALGQPLSVSEFVTRAGVSRAWFYGQPHLRERLRMIGQSQRRNQHRSKPDDAASRASLQRRLELAHERIKQLTDRNRELEEQLSRVLGERRRLH
jgi:site-specific DNA-cytosine methylase